MANKMLLSLREVSRTRVGSLSLPDASLRESVRFVACGLVGFRIAEALSDNDPVFPFHSPWWLSLIVPFIMGFFIYSGLVVLDRVLVNGRPLPDWLRPNGLAWYLTPCFGPFIVWSLMGSPTPMIWGSGNFFEGLLGYAIELYVAYVLLSLAFRALARLISAAQSIKRSAA